MSGAKSELAQKLERLANEIADQVLAPDNVIKIEDKIAALQRLSLFWQMLEKSDSPDFQDSSFGSYRHAIETSSLGGTGHRNGSVAADPDRPYAIALDGHGFGEGSE